MRNLWFKMGGIIEDIIFEVLQDKKMAARQILGDCSSRGYNRTSGIIGRHLRKMVVLQQLSREKSDGVYVYYNPAMVGGAL